MSCDPNILQLQIMSVWVKIDCNPWPLLNNSSLREEQGDALQKNPFGSALFTLKMITMIFSSDQLLLRLAASCPPCLWSPFLSRCPGNKARISFQTSKIVLYHKILASRKLSGRQLKDTVNIIFGTCQVRPKNLTNTNLLFADRSQKWKLAVPRELPITAYFKRAT